MVRNRKRDKIGKHSDYFELENIAITYFISNIPDGYKEKEIWSILKEQGNLVDFYLAKKKDRNGTNFGFARFIRVLDAHLLERNLNRIAVGHSILHANVAKFGRENRGATAQVTSRTQFQNQKQEGWVRYASRTQDQNQKHEGGIRHIDLHNMKPHSGNHQVPPFIHNSRSGGLNDSGILHSSRTYADIVQRKSIAVENSVTIPEFFTPRSCYWLERCLIGELKDYECLVSFFNIIKAAKIITATVKYLGALLVI